MQHSSLQATWRMSSAVSVGDARTAPHILSSHFARHPAVVHFSPPTPSLALNQSGLLPKSGAKKLLQEEPRRQCVPELFSSFYRHIRAQFYKSWLGSKLIKNSQQLWYSKPHHASHFRPWNILLHKCFCIPKLTGTSFILQAINWNMRCALTYSLVLFEPPVQSERCRTIQNQARIFLSCTGCRSLFISWWVCGAVNPPSAWQLKLHL